MQEQRWIKFNNPLVPFLQPLAGITVGTRVLIKAKLNDEVPTGFSVNLVNNIGDFIHVPLHFNVPFNRPQRVVVRNAQNNGKWKTEETDGEFPFQAGQIFEIMITVTQGSYEIDVMVAGNDITHYVYEHKLPIEDVRGLTVKGDLIIHDLEIRNF